MSIGKVSNKQSLSPGFNKKTSEQQEQQVKKIIIGEIDCEVWSIECTVDELQLNLCRIKEYITFPLESDNRGQGTKTLTVHKYYRQARELMMWIPIARPVPEFVINANDLSPKVVKELEVRVDDSLTFVYILKQAVGRIFENLDFNRYHLSVAKNLRVRLEP